MIDGVLLLDKPLGASSNRALQIARGLFGRAKAGHTGTLDPLASGLLPLCFGEATKYSALMLEADKTYTAVIRLGVKTTTGDAEGEVLETRPIAFDDVSLEKTLASFRGEITQVPPMHSALKHEGKPLYAYIRAGVEIERPARQVTIRELVLNRRLGDELHVTVCCSKGTYIRVLAEDIGEMLGCGAHLSMLRRVAAGPFSLDGALTLEELEAMDLDGRIASLLPVDALLGGFSARTVDEHSARRLLSGLEVETGEGIPAEIRVYGEAGSFLGLAELTHAGKLRPKRMMCAEKIRLR